MEFDGETLRVTPKNRITAAHLGGKKGKTLTLESRDIVNVNFVKATRLRNGSVTVGDTSGTARIILFTWRKADQPGQELAEMLTALARAK